MALQISKGHPLSLIQVNLGLLVLQDAACVTAPQRQPGGTDQSDLRVRVRGFVHTTENWKTCLANKRRSFLRSENIFLVHTFF